MDRIINVNVGGNYISKDGKNAGVKGEANVTFLRISFDESWDDFAKKVVFIDSHGVNAVNVLLGLSMLEDINESERVYLVPIPAEPLAEAGSMTFIIEGTKDDKVKKSFQDKLDVKDAPDSSEAAQPVPPTPSEVEQMQADIEAIKADVSVAAKAGAEAVAARDEILGMTVSAETLAAGSKATVENIGADGKAHLRFGIPKGKDGKDGKDGVSISQADVDKSNNLILTFTDGTKKNAGSVLSDTMSAALDGPDSVAFNDKVGNKANVANAFVAGKNNRAVLRGFNIKGVDASGGLYLDSVEGLVEGTLVAYFKETEGGVVRYRDKVASIVAICPECTEEYGADGKYLMPFATPYIGGNTDDVAWKKASFFGTKPSITTWRGVPTTNSNFKNASLKITHDDSAVYVLITTALNFRAPISNIEVSIRVPNSVSDIKAAFYKDAFDSTDSNISNASISIVWVDDYNYTFELAIPCDNIQQNADILVNVGCFFSNGNGSEVHFNWGGTQVEWGNVPHINETKAIKAVAVPPCQHGELVMFEDQIKTGIINGEITLVYAEDAYYANGAYIIARATDKGREDIGTAAYSERETLGSTELTTKDGSHVTAFIAGRDNIVSIDAAAFGHDNDALGYQAVSFGRYNRNYGDRGALFGYMNWLLGHEGFIAGVKNTGTGYACFIGGGESNESLGDYSHSSGYDTKVTKEARAGRASGVGTISNGEAQDASGMYNEFDEEGKYLSIVGNGTSRENRSNAYTLDREGNAWFAGEITYGPGRNKIADWIAGEVRTLLAPNIDADWLPCSGGLVRSSYGGMFDEAPLNAGVSEQVTEAIVPDHITDSGVGYMVRDGALYVSYDVTAMPWQKVLPTCSCSKVMGYGNVVLYYRDRAVYDLSTREKCFNFTDTDENMLSGTWISGADNALLVYSKNYSVGGVEKVVVVTMLCDKTGILERKLNDLEGNVGDSGAFFDGAYYFTIGKGDGHHLLRYVSGGAISDTCNLGAGEVSHVYGAYGGKIIVGRLLCEPNPEAAGMIDHTLYVMAYDRSTFSLSNIASMATYYTQEINRDAFTSVLIGKYILSIEDEKIYKIDVSTGAKETIQCDRYGKAYAWKDPAKQCAVFACKDAYADVTADCLFRYYEGTMYRLPVASFADGYGSYIYVGGVFS